MDEKSFQEFLDSIPSIDNTLSESYRIDLVGLTVERSFQTYQAFWKAFPGAHRRMIAIFKQKLGEDWEDCFEEYLRRPKGVHVLQ